jgi:hypothetical protein
MRKITTAITAAALAFSMLAAAVPAAAAVPGYDSAYAGESAFVNISAGQTQNFQVFFANTGTTAWQRGTGTQVDLAACLEDKVTCNAQDASEATWNSGWLSAVRYATTVQTVTPPGSLGTFSYNITAPAGVAGGIYRFNGDLVLASTGEKIHPDGYYQEANTGAPTGAATITSLTPNNGTNAGGTDVVISGSGIICNPTFPTVSFGGTNGTVLSCGATSVTVDSPAHATGSVTVTVSNPGAPASNGLTYTYTDTSRPTFDSVTVSGNLVTAVFSEPICRVLAHDATDPGGDWTINNISSGGVSIADTGDSIPICDAEFDNGVSTVTIQMLTPVTNGAFVEVTLNARNIATAASDNESMRDVAGNFASAPQARQATATAPETTAPTLVSASGAVGSTTLTLNFSEPVKCVGLTYGGEDISLTDNDPATTDPTVTGAGTNLCGGTSTSADTSFSVTLGSSLPADRTYTVTVTAEAGQIEDIVGNDLVNPSSVAFTTGAGDFTPPTIVDARMTQNVGTSDFTEAQDAFSLTFSEAMNGVDESGSITVQDQDGTVLVLDCGLAAVGCTWNTADTTVTVTLQSLFVAPAVGAPGAGTTPGMQIPFNVTTTSGSSFSDLQGNAVNVLGSADRLVDFE